MTVVGCWLGFFSYPISVSRVSGGRVKIWVVVREGTSRPYFRDEVDAFSTRKECERWADTNCSGDAGFVRVDLPKHTIPSDR